MDDGHSASVRARWARLRFSVIGTLLASPPETGELQDRLGQLAKMQWEHPTTGDNIKLSFSTIERWYYRARGEEPDPFAKLVRRVRKDTGTHPTINQDLSEAIATQYRDHPTWTYQLHRDNLIALAETTPELGTVPSRSTLIRYMKERGMLKQKKKRHKTACRPACNEQRSWEVLHVNQLWHLDFHEGSRSVLMPDGKRIRPWMVGILDDHSRLACHVQWYLVENTENLVHGLSQALQKRGLPRALLTDGGGAMKAAETQQGLSRLSILHEMTLPETPQQNGKQEHFWTHVEQRLLPMLEGVPDLTLRLLNEATQAWVESEYNHHLHSVTGQSPMDRYLSDTNLGRPCPDSDCLRQFFRTRQTRAQRRSDGTISVEGIRFEVPSRYRALRRVTLEYARWNLSQVDLVDSRHDTILCTLYPLDRNRNADTARRSLEPIADPTIEIAQAPAKQSGMAPLLQSFMAKYASSGLMCAYLPKDEVSPLVQES